MRNHPDLLICDCCYERIPYFVWEVCPTFIYLRVRGEFRSSLTPAELQDKHYLMDREENRSQVGPQNHIWRASLALQY